MQQYESGTGGLKEVKQERYDLMPVGALAEVARAYGYGQEKYPTEPGDIDNWRKGYPWSLSYAAAVRHFSAFWGGESFDSESGLHHLASAAFHTLTLLTWDLSPYETEYDDRQEVLSQTRYEVSAFAKALVEACDAREAGSAAGRGDGRPGRYLDLGEEFLSTAPAGTRILADIRRWPKAVIWPRGGTWSVILEAADTAESNEWRAVPDQPVFPFCVTQPRYDYIDVIAVIKEPAPTPTQAGGAHA